MFTKIYVTTWYHRATLSCASFKTEDLVEEKDWFFDRCWFAIICSDIGKQYWQSVAPPPPPPPPRLCSDIQRSCFNFYIPLYVVRVCWKKMFKEYFLQYIEKSAHKIYRMDLNDRLQLIHPMQRWPIQHWFMNLLLILSIYLDTTLMNRTGIITVCSIYTTVIKVPVI